MHNYVLDKKKRRKEGKKENVDAILAVGLIHPSFDGAERYPPTAPKILSLISIPTAITEKGWTIRESWTPTRGFHRSRSHTSCPETLLSLQKMDGDVGYLRCFVERERRVWGRPRFYIRRQAWSFFLADGHWRAPRGSTRG